MKFSLVFATRDRVELLSGLIKSIAAMTEDKAGVEVMPIYDDDDEGTHEAALRLVEEHPSLVLRFVRRSRSRALNRDYINFGSRMARGKYIFILNDDTEFMTKGWDALAWAKLEGYLSDKKDGIVYGCIDDSMNSLRMEQNLLYCGFPIVSRAGVEALGYAMHPSFMSWGADGHLYTVYDKVGRVVRLDEVKIFHHSPYNNSREKDAIHHHVAMLGESSVTSMYEAHDLMGEDVRRLCSAIGVEPPAPPEPLPPPPSPPKPKPKPGSHAQAEVAMAAYRKRIAALERKGFRSRQSGRH